MSRDYSRTVSYYDFLLIGFSASGLSTPMCFLSVASWPCVHIHLNGEKKTRFMGNFFHALRGCGGYNYSSPQGVFLLFLSVDVFFIYEVI